MLQVKFAEYNVFGTLFCLFLTLIFQKNGAAIAIHCVSTAQSHDLCMTCGYVCEEENPTGTSCCGTKTKKQTLVKTESCQNLTVQIYGY